MEHKLAIAGIFPFLSSQRDHFGQRYHPIPTWVLKRYHPIPSWVLLLMSQVLLVQPRTEDWQRGRVFHLKMMLKMMVMKMVMVMRMMMISILILIIGTLLNDLPLPSVSSSHPRSWGNQFISIFSLLIYGKNVGASSWTNFSHIAVP